MLIQLSILNYSRSSIQIPPSCYKSKNFKPDSSTYDIVYYDEGCLPIIERTVNVTDGIMVGLNAAVILTMVFNIFS